jgi:Abnormal spindle-like microcephaly-assoc'd, ASPM-SPD-2-Hydin
MKSLSLAVFTFCLVVLLGGCGGGKNSGFGGGTASVTLAPPTLTFPSQIVGTTSSPAQTVTLTNSGTVTLNIMGVMASANYSADSSACGATLAAGANCVISVTFTPTSTGMLTGTITVTDNTSTSPQTVALTGTGS